MTTTPTSPCAPLRTRMAIVLVLSIMLLLTSAGVATAQWVTAATTTIPATAGTLTTGVAGTAGLGANNIDTDDYTTPVALTIDTPAPVPVDYTLQFHTRAGTLDPDEVTLTVWEPTGATCPTTVPDTDTDSGTLATPPPLPTSRAVDEPHIVVCAATRFTGTLAESAGHFLTTSPILTAQLVTGTWTATARGDDLTHTMSSDPDGDPVEDPTKGLPEDPTGDLAGDPTEDPSEEPTRGLPEGITKGTTGDLPEEPSDPVDDPAEDPTSELPEAPTDDPADGLSPVTNLVCTDQDELPSLTDRGIELTWDPVTGATSYRILASTGRTLEVLAPTVDLDTHDLGQADWIDVQALSPTEQSPTVRHEVHVHVTDNLEETLRCT